MNWWHLCTPYHIFLSISVSIFHFRFASVCTHTSHILLWLWNLIPDGNHERRWRRRQKYRRQSGSSRRCACGDHNPTVVCAIIAHGGRVRRVESMTSCQSWNGNLAAKRGTSQLPATANNLRRSRSSAIHERVSTVYAATIIENRRSIGEVFISGEETSRVPGALFPPPIVVSYTGEAINFDYQNNLRIISRCHRNGVIIFVAESCSSYLLSIFPFNFYINRTCALHEIFLYVIDDDTSQLSHS